MTQPAPTVVHFPEPTFPMLTRVVTNSLLPDDTVKKVMWEMGKAHPLIGPTMNVVRMFIVAGVVEIYSVKSDGSFGMVNIVPFHNVCSSEQVMDLPTMIRHLSEAEEDNEGQRALGGEDPDEEPEEEEPPSERSPAPAKTQAPS